MLFQKVTEIAAECEENCTGSLKAVLRRGKEIVPGYDFLDTVKNASEYRFSVSGEDIDPAAHSLLLQVRQEQGEPLRGDFTAVDSSFSPAREVPLATYNNRGYFLRLYPHGKKRTIEQVLETVTLVASVPNRTRLSISALPKKGYEVLEELTIAGDYVEKGRHNCYSTMNLGNETGMVVVQLERPEIEFYANQGSLPKRPDDFSYKYTKGEFGVNPTDGFAAVAFPVPRWPNVTDEGKDNKTYFCIVGTGVGLAYALDASKYTPLPLEENQRQKIYLNGRPGQLLYYSRIVRHNTPETLALNVVKGCVHVMVKPQQTFFYGYLLYGNLTAGTSPFMSVPIGASIFDTSIYPHLVPRFGEVERPLAVPKRKHDVEGSLETLCSGDRVFAECPSFILVENCENEPASEITVMVGRKDTMKVVGGDPLLLFITKGKKEFVAITDVAPAVDDVKIVLQVRERSQEGRLARVAVSRHGPVKSISDVEKGVIEIPGTRAETVLEFRKETEGDLAGDYYLTIEADQSISIKITAETTANISHVAHTVRNVRQVSSSNFFMLSPVNSTYQVGYFTFYMNNTMKTGEVRPQDALILGNPTGSMTSLSISAATDSWSTAAQGVSNIHRFSRSDPAYKLNTYYYITAQGMPSPLETTDGRESGLMNFLVLEERRHTDLVMNRIMHFGGTRLFRFRANTTGGYYSVRLGGVTVESMYVSASEHNRVPFRDQNDYVLEPKLGEGVDEYPEFMHQEIRLPTRELEKKNAECGTRTGCDVWVTVFCHWPRCYYSLQAKFVAGGEEAVRDKKADL